MPKAKVRTAPPPPDVMKEARGVYQRQLSLPKDKQQEDIWWAINKDWDINIFLDENDNLQASLYYVNHSSGSDWSKGDTDVSQSWSVKID